MLILANRFDDQAAEEVVKTVRVEAFDHFGARCSDDHQCGRGVTVIGVEQFGAGGRIAAHVALFEDEFPRLEKNPHYLAVEAAGLGEEQNSVSHEFAASFCYFASSDLRIRSRS